MIEFQLPEVGENIETGTVLSIEVSVGDSVQKDQELLELETDKATIPVPSPVDGVIKEILISEGEEIKIGSVIMKIEEDSSAASQVKSAKEPKKETKTAPKKSAPKKEQAQPKLQEASKSRSLPNESIPAQIDVPAAPAVRRLARELGIIVSQVPGSGPGGRINKDDVKAYAKGLILSGGAAVAGAPIRNLPEFTKWGKVEREKMNNVRKKTAEHLSYCWNSIPHVTQFDKADITELETLRREKSTDKRKITITSFLLKVMAEALKEFPQFNASIDMETQEIIYKKYFNLGIAVDTDRGLLVPVIRDVDKKGVIELTDELTEIAERARKRKTSLDELQGGSITLTNLGGIGGHAFTPIINWPEVAILGTSRGKYEPVYNKKSNAFEPRFKLPLSLSYDHRIIDGADGARFLRWICNRIEQSPWADELQ